MDKRVYNFWYVKKLQGCKFSSLRGTDFKMQKYLKMKLANI